MTSNGGAKPASLVNSQRWVYIRNLLFKGSSRFLVSLPMFMLIYSHTSFYELPLYETSELRNRFLEVTASTKNQQIL